MNEYLIKAKNFFLYNSVRLVFNSKPYLDAVKDKSGIEIGGPSAIFQIKNLIPLYNVIAHLDNCNFSQSTVWEGALREGEHFTFGNKKGFQYIREASDLHGIEDNKYDFLLSSHCLEHCANAIKTLNEWSRVVKSKGYLLIVVPNKEKTFDHKRPLTTLDHFQEDYAKGVGEEDLSHLEEIFQYHDLFMDKRAGTISEFKTRSQSNFENRCIHHHTFSLDNTTKLIELVGLTVLRKEYQFPHHTIVLAQKN